MFISLADNHKDIIDSPVSGPAYVAIETQCPVIPVKINVPRWAIFHLKGILRPKGSFRIDVTAGKSIYPKTKEQNKDSRSALTKEITSIINNL